MKNEKCILWHRKYVFFFFSKGSLKKNLWACAYNWNSKQNLLKCVGGGDSSCVIHSFVSVTAVSEQNITSANSHSMQNTDSRMLSNSGFSLDSLVGLDKRWQWHTHWSRGWQKEKCWLPCCSGDIAKDTRKRFTFGFFLITCFFFS